jgi:DNA-binding transcriptional LysR family regulator
MDDWPNLRGRARIRIDAPEGLRPLALAGMGIAPDPGRWLGAALAGARLEVRYGR